MLSTFSFGLRDLVLSQCPFEEDLISGQQNIVSHSPCKMKYQNFLDVTTVHW